MIEADHKSEVRLTTDNPYLTLTGELWDVYCENIGEDWLRYNSSLL